MFIFNTKFRFFAESEIKLQPVAQYFTLNVSPGRHDDIPASSLLFCLGFPVGVIGIKRYVIGDC